MAADPDQVQVAVNGSVSVAPTGTTAPTNSTTALNVAFADVGEIGEDGITESYSDDVTEIRNNNGTTIRRVITGSGATLSFTMLETSAATLELYHKGSSVTGSTGAYAIHVKEVNSVRNAVVLDVLDGTTHVRIYAGNAEVGERGDIVYNAGVPIGYQVTISCYPDSNGDLLVKFSDSEAWA